LELRPNRYQGVVDLPGESCSFNSDSDIVVEEREGLNPVSTTTIADGEELVLSCISSEGYEMFRKDRNKVGCVDGSLNIEFDGCRIPAVIVLRAENSDEGGINLKNGSSDCIIDWGDGSEPEECIGGGLSNHVYNSAGDYTVKVIGNTFWGFEGCNGSSSFGIKELHSMGKWKNNITNLDSAFGDCQSLDYVHPDAFKYLTEVTSFSGVFFNCTSLTSVPAGLFANNEKAKNFSYAFYGSGLTSVPSGLFANNKKATSFYWLFVYSLGGLSSIPSDLFEVDFESRPSFGYMFYHTSIPCSALATQRWWSDKTLDEIATETRCSI
jgi:hypothetical protein